MSPELQALAEAYAEAVRADFECWCRYVDAVCVKKDEQLSGKVDGERTWLVQRVHEAQTAFEAKIREEARAEMNAGPGATQGQR